jgi:primosomal protein N' (replication factor Y)
VDKVDFNDSISKQNIIYTELINGKKYQEYKDYVLKSLEEFEEITAYKSIKIDMFVDF